ncbi:hypothetical protein ACPXCE_04585 [Streptomyces sp. DT24]|nr:hypothetical protein [Streptomyces sp. AM 4-1-1]WEH35808.1 hypothetical protein PZB75_22095 [Streptomyces sp. AM 4-1-1]
MGTPSARAFDSSVATAQREGTAMVKHYFKYALSTLTAAMFVSMA